MSLLSLAIETIPSVKVIRSFRALRVVRIFKRLHSLRTIMSALALSIVPMLNSSFVLLMATTIYSIMGVLLYRQRDFAHFGNFSRAFLTMFQCLTGDAWASAVARQMFDTHETFDSGLVVFFISYQMIVSMVLMNVLVGIEIPNPGSWTLDLTLCTLD